MMIITIDKNNFLISVPSFPLFLHCTLYSIFVPYLLHSFPESFTLCEVSLVSQGASLLLTDTSLLILSKVSFIPYNNHWHSLTVPLKWQDTEQP